MSRASEGSAVLKVRRGGAAEAAAADHSCSTLWNAHVCLANATFDPFRQLQKSGSRSTSAEGEAIKEAKASTLRFAHPTLKQSYRAIAEMK